MTDHGGDMTDDESQTQVETPVQEQRRGAEVSADQYDDSHTPKKFRNLTDLYENTEEVEHEEELFLMGLEEPSCYNQAKKSSDWRQAMKSEIASIERNGTWKLANLPSGSIGLSSVFEMSDMGKLSYYLGIEVKQSADCIELKQSSYARKVLEKAGMSRCNSCKYPMDPNVMITKDETGKAVDATYFKSLVGGLRYLVHTRPDIAYAVGVVSRHMERPTVTHLDAAKRILRYIQGTLSYGLVYTKEGGNNVLTGYSDSDLAGNLDDWKSTGAMAFYLNESLVTWVSQKQRCVALSTCEAEFMAATSAACQGIWLRNVLMQVTGEQLGPVVIYIDNRSAIDLAKNPVFHGRSKHIDIRFHFIRECVEQGDIVVKHVSGESQRADILTKAVVTVKFERMRKLLGMKELGKQV